MKDKFRIRFSYIGWTIQHSYWGIFWRNIGGYEYYSKEEALKVAENLRKGEADSFWFNRDKKKQ